MLSALLAAALAQAGCATAFGGLPAPRDPDASGVYDVIIVGAGIAGLSAAHELMRNGRSVLVLEATDRIGGRAQTDQSTFAAPIDLGGAWIHGVGTNPLTTMADALGYQRAPTELSGDIFFKDRFLNKAEYDEWTEAFEKYQERLKDKDQFASELLPTDENDPGFKFRHLLAANTGPFEASEEASRISAADVSAFLAEDDDLVPRGIGTMVHEFGRGVPVRLGSRVTRIAYSNEGEVAKVEIARSQSDGGINTFKARRVLVTVSTGVLASGRIAFLPELPAWKKEAIEKLPMGLLNKVILQFDSDFFQHTGDTSWVLYQGPEEGSAAPNTMAFVMKTLGLPLVVAFYGGDKAHDHDDRCISEAEKRCASSDTQCRASAVKGCDVVAIAHVLEVLRAMYGATAVPAPTRQLVTHWASADWALGSYSAARPGWIWTGPKSEKDEAPPPENVHEALARPVGGVVYFAGEACARPMYNGSFPGAYESGRRAARGIIDSLEPRQPHRPHFHGPTIGSDRPTAAR